MSSYDHITRNNLMQLMAQLDWKETKEKDIFGKWLVKSIWFHLKEYTQKERRKYLNCLSEAFCVGEIEFILDQLKNCAVYKRGNREIFDDILVYFRREPIGGDRK